MMICEEMKKLRAWLDASKIEWEDVSMNPPADLPMLGICRTHFKINGYRFSVINGYGSYGGDSGLLEMM